MLDKTTLFNLDELSNALVRTTLDEVYEALNDKEIGQQNVSTTMENICNCQGNIQNFK